MKNILSLLVCLAICLAVGGVAGYGTAASVSTWYPTLNKPFFNPPDWVFGPVWTILYTMMAVALWLVWKSDQPQQAIRKALVAFAVQLILNFWWSFIFFSLQSVSLALIEIVFLWFAIGYTIHLFRQLVPLTVWLLAPYLAWVGFAWALTASIWWLN